MDNRDDRPICPSDFFNYRSPYPLKDEIYDKSINTMNLTTPENLQRNHIAKVRNVWRVFQQGLLQELRKYNFERKKYF
jgi:hypothetical protein